MMDRLRTRTYSTLQLDRVRTRTAEGHGGDPVRWLSGGGDASHNTVAVDLDLRAPHGCSHGVLHSWVWEAGPVRFWTEDQVDPSSRDPEAQQSLHGGVHVQAASEHHGVFCNRSGSESAAPQKGRWSGQLGDTYRPAP